MGTVITYVLMALYLTLIVCVLCAIFFVHKIAETERDHTDERLKAELKAELELTKAELARATAGVAKATEGTAAVTATAAASRHLSSTLPTHHERAPLLGAQATLAAQVQESADLRRLESNESAAGSDFASVAELEESTEVPPYRAGAARR